MLAPWPRNQSISSNNKLISHVFLLIRSCITLFSGIDLNFLKISLICVLDGSAVMMLMMMIVMMVAKGTLPREPQWSVQQGESVKDGRESSPGVHSECAA